MPSPWPYGTPIGTCLETRMRIKACKSFRMTILGVGPFVAAFGHPTHSNWPRRRPAPFAPFHPPCIPALAYAPPCTCRPPVVRLKVDSREAHGAPLLHGKFPANYVSICITGTGADTELLTMQRFGRGLCLLLSQQQARSRRNKNKATKRTEEPTWIWTET